MADKMFGISLADQRAKYLLVAVLGAILLAVIVWPGEAPPAAAGTGAPARHGETTGQPTQPAGRPAVSAKAKAAGKKPTLRRAFTAAPAGELEATLKFNPFAASELLQAQLPGSQPTPTDKQAQEEQAERTRALATAQRLNEFRTKKVKLLLRTPDGAAAALIGDELLVREGQIVDGLRIVSISHEGVVVEAVSPPQ